MTMYPPIMDSAYYKDGDIDILKRMDWTYAKNITINQSFWSEADLDTRFKAGDQTLWNDVYGNLPAFRRRQFNFNRIRRVIDMITGRQRQFRKSTVSIPIENASQKTSDQFSKLLFHVNERGSILPIISDAFEGAVTTGMNLLSVWMDWRNDPVNGEIKVDNVSWNSYLLDPYFKKMDLSDCESIWTRKYLSLNQINSLLPGREDEINAMGNGWGNRDGKFQFMAESYQYGNLDLLIYDEFWYLSSRPCTFIADVKSGETMEWKGPQEEIEGFLSLYPNVIKFTHDISTVKLAIAVQNKVMYHGPNPLGLDVYPFVPVWAYYQPELPSFSWRCQGVVRGLRDAQYLYNRRKIIELDILESQINSGFYFRESALVNPKDVFLQGQGRGLALKDDPRPMDDLIRKIEAPQVPPSMIELSQLLGKEITEISGVNEELLGSATDDKAGVLSMLRQGAGLITLQKLFDNLDYSQKLLGNIFIKLIQNNWTPGKVRRIIGEEPTEEFYSGAFGKYDAVVEEGLNTSTQKQMQFAQLLQIRELGVPVPSELLISNSTLQNKEELINAIQRQEQQQSQEAQNQQFIQLEVLKSQIEDLQSRAMANKGLFVERASRVEENRALAVERIAAAQKDRDMGALERVKAAKELTDIDLSHLQKALDIIASIQEREREEAKAQGKKEVAESSALRSAEGAVV